MRFAGSRMVHNEDKEEKGDIEMVTPNKIYLDFEQERKIQSLPSFSLKTGEELGSGPKALKYSEYKPLTIYNLPWFFWLIGILFICVVILLIVNMALSAPSKMFDAFNGKHVWEYIVVVLIFLFGISFFFAAKFEKIVVNKAEDDLLLYKFSLYRFKAETLNIKISSLNTIFPTRIETTHAETSRTCLNKIGFRFNDTEVVYMFQTIFTYTLINTVIKLRAYIFNKLSPFESVEWELKGTETHMDVLRR